MHVHTHFATETRIHKAAARLSQSKSSSMKWLFSEPAGLWLALASHFMSFQHGVCPLLQIQINCRKPKIFLLRVRCRMFFSVLLCAVLAALRGLIFVRLLCILCTIAKQRWKSLLPMALASCYCLPAVLLSVPFLHKAR